MKISYDPGVDVLRILFKNRPIDESDEARPGLILDFDDQGDVVGIEVLNASVFVEDPRTVDYALRG